MARFPFSFMQFCEKAPWQRHQQDHPRKQTSHDAHGTAPTPSLSYDPKKVQKAKRYSDLMIWIVQRLHYQVWKSCVCEHKTIYILFMNEV